MQRGLVLVVLLVLVACVGVPQPALAQPIDRRDLPPELRPWVPWVLDTVPGLGCPQVQGQPVCVWPGRLRLDLDEDGGRFSLAVRADREADLLLPGSAQRWPLDVRLDGRAVPVFEKGGGPQLRVPPGRHRVSGRFTWSRLPESLSVPPSIGLLELTLDGRPVARPRRERAGLLWLRARTDDSTGEGEGLRLQVFRHVADGIPLFVQTRLQLEVSGRAREVGFPSVLLPDAHPVAVRGDLPARVEDGTLHVQVRGGRFTVSVQTRLEGRPEELGRPTPADEDGPGAAAWPEREVWVFAANDTLRQVELSGPSAIDPSRTELPSEWTRLPAFLVEPDDRLRIRTVRRGQPEPPPDALTLFREMWLAPDGEQATVRDNFTGTLHGTTRLDLLPPGDLGRVAVDGQDQLVTTTAESEAAGVELRRASLRLEADSRLTLDGALPAVGWSTPVEQLRVRLHLPPGWTLLGSRGVDHVAGTWTSRWTLLGFFFVLLVAFGAHRLFGPRHAVLAAITLVLTHGEPGAPFLLWLSLLGAIALRRVAPEGRLGSLGRIWFLVSAALLVLLLVPFARDQVKAALFPQVARVGPPAGRGVGIADRAMEADQPAAPVPTSPAAPAEGHAAPEELEEEPARKRAMLQGAMDEVRQVSEKVEGYASYNIALQQDPKAVLQTGPGLPSWTWRTHTLTWTGPVGPDHRMRLLLASPGLNRVLTLARLMALGLLTFVLLSGRWPRLRRRLPTAGAATAALLLLGATDARPQEPTTPTPRILEELKQRLTRPAPCAPRCVTAPNLRLGLSESRLQVGVEVHAAAEGSWPLPGPLSSWAPAEVLVDGAPATALAHLRDGFLHVRLAPGVHRVEASGPVPPGDSFTLQFAEPPRRARAEAPAWQVTGLRSDGPPDASILLSRRLAAASGPARAEGQYAPWLEITRTLGFGVSWTVQTHVRRLTPRGTPVAVRVPLLPGEAPTRADLVVEGGEAAVSLGRDEVETRWQSTLEQTSAITLQSPEGRPWSEVWRLQCSPVWSCTADGLPPVRRISGGLFEPEYRPWPGETLEVTQDHPSGVEGQTLTIDSIQLDATPGSRLERTELTVHSRSSREQPLLLNLPETAEVQQVLLDGQERPLRPEGGELSVTVPIGDHRLQLRWQEPRGMGLVYSLPRVGVPGPAVNVAQQLTLPPSRWLLLTWGPSWGPAVLFWPYILFLLGVSWALGRLPWSPLTSLQWVLLGLGLSQIPAVGALVVAGFVFALALRRERQPSGPFVFDVMQLALVAWALVSLVFLYAAIHTGLLFRPDMQVAGNGSTDTVLRWYADRVQGETPSAGVVSLPLWVYRVGMLVWALWLAASLVRAIGWGWRVFGTGGFWKRLRRRRVVEPETRVEDEGPSEGGKGPSEGREGTGEDEGPPS